MSANGSSICASAWCTLEIVLYLLRRQYWVSGGALSEDYTDTRGLFLPVLYKSLNFTAYISHHAELDLIFVKFAPFSRMQPTTTQCDSYSFYCRSDQIFYVGNCILCLSTGSQGDAALLQLWSHRQIVWCTCTDWITWPCWDCTSHDQHFPLVSAIYRNTGKQSEKSQK